MAGVKAEHIPYKGTGPALADLMAQEGVVVVDAEKEWVLRLPDEV